MDNHYLQELIEEANARGGGLLLNFQDKPAVVVLSIDRYNLLLNQMQNTATLSYGQDTAVLTVPRPIKNPVKQKVLVTGGAGYIGGHLVRELIKAGYEVVVLDNLSTGRKENIDPKAVFIEGDLADESLLKDVFAANNIEAVFHMAASLEVEESVKEPAKYLQNNLVNTVKLLSAMAEGGVRKIIFSSTASVYGEPDQVPVPESAHLRPNNPYGASKLLAERVIRYFCRNLGLKAVIFRYFNACGFDTEARILPTHQSHLIYKVMQVAKGVMPHLEVFGNDYPTTDGTCVRDYVHVLDIVLPHILALEKMDDMDKFEIFNIGTGRGSSVVEVATCASEFLGKIIPMEVGPRRAGDAPVTVADNAKLLNNLGYRLKYSSLENMLVSSWKVMKDV
jgi:UDP-glucose 4-epimerase